MAAYWRVGLLAVVTTLVWVTHYDRWTLASWQIPLSYGGDALEILTRIQASAEGDTVPLRPQVITRLGAPFGANWSAYPSSDLLLIWLLGQGARVVGVYVVANLAVWLATVIFTGGVGGGGMITAALSLAVFMVIVGVGQMFVITLGPGNVDLSLPANIGLASAVAMKVMGGDDAMIVVGLMAALASGTAWSSTPRA